MIEFETPIEYDNGTPSRVATQWFWTGETKIVRVQPNQVTYIREAGEVLYDDRVEPITLIYFAAGMSVKVLGTATEVDQKLNPPAYHIETSGLTGNYED